MIGCNKCLSSFCPPTTVHINLITFNLCAFTAPFLFPIGPSPPFQPYFSHGNSFLSPSPFIYLKFPSNVFFAFLIQSSKFHYHFLPIILPYLFSNFALPLASHVRQLSNISTFLPSSFPLYLSASPLQTFAPCRSNIFQYRPAPRLRRLVGGPSQRRYGFISRSVRVRLVL